MDRNSTALFSEIRDRYAEVRARIKAAAEKAGRSPEEIALVAVTKMVAVAAIQEAMKVGMTDFGENYMQEAKEKIDSLGKTVRWHFIGHLQKNKVNLAADYFHMIQSIDSVPLAEKLNARCAAPGKTLNVLLQVHYGEEATKHGFLPGEVGSAMEQIAMLENLHVQGLMTIPPLVADPEENRKYFRDLSRLAHLLTSAGYGNWENKYLSMGMTDDFEIAIEEGSTMVRIGRAIFGERS